MNYLHYFRWLLLFFVFLTSLLTASDDVEYLQSFRLLTPETFPVPDSELNAISECLRTAPNSGGIRGNGKSLSMFGVISNGQVLESYVFNDGSQNIPQCLVDFFGKVAALPGANQYLDFVVEITLNERFNEKKTSQEGESFRVVFHRDSSAVPTHFLAVYALNTNIPDHDFLLGRIRSEHVAKVTNRPIETTTGFSGETFPNDQVQIIAKNPVRRGNGYFLSEDESEVAKQIFHATNHVNVPGSFEATREVVLIRLTPKGSRVYPAALKSINENLRSMYVNEYAIYFFLMRVVEASDSLEYWINYLTNQNHDNPQRINSSDSVVIPAHFAASLALGWRFPGFYETRKRVLYPLAYSTMFAINRIMLSQAENLLPVVVSLSIGFRLSNGNPFLMLAGPLVVVFAEKMNSRDVVYKIVGTAVASASLVQSMSFIRQGRGAHFIVFGIGNLISSAMLLTALIHSNFIL